MPKRSQPDPYDALLIRAAHDPLLAARIQVAEQLAQEPAGARPILLPPQAHEPPDPEPADPDPESAVPVALAHLPPTAGAPNSDPPRKPLEWGYVAPARGKSPGGRPRKVAPWFEAVAHEMRDGTSLRAALRRCGVSLTDREIKRLRDNIAFVQMYQRERREFLRTWGRARICRGARVQDFFRGPRGDNL